MTPDQSSSPQWLNEFKQRLDFGAVLFAPYILALVWQYFAIVKIKLLAWSLAVIVAGCIWLVYVALKEVVSERLSRWFWLVVALPLLLVYSIRFAFPDISFDVLNYHLFNSERALRGPLFLTQDFFPVVATFNPTPDVLAGLYRHLLGYRMGTAMNLLTLIWTGAILDRLLREYFRRAWCRSLSVLFVLFTEQILFQINNYMVDLLALPLLLEATVLSIAARRFQIRQILLLAFLLGAATAFKLTNLVFAVPIVIVYVFNLTTGEGRDKPARLFLQLLKSIPLATVLFVAPSVPFTIFIYKLTGNPIFPLYNVIFRSPYWPKSAVLDPRWGPLGIVETVAWPVAMFFHPQRLSEFARYSGRLSIGYISAVVCLFVAGRDRNIRAIAFIAIVSAILWSAGSGYIRYALFLELTGGVLLIWLAQYLWKKCQPCPGWVRVLAPAPLLILLIGQTYFALKYISQWEWSARPTVLKSEAAFVHEATNSFRDRSLRSYVATENLAMFDEVDVWVETTYKTTGFTSLLKPDIPGIGVRMPNYFLTPAAREKFSDTLQSLKGKRMFTLTTAEGIDGARAALAARGLSMEKPRAVSIYYFSDSLKFDVLLAEIVPSWHDDSSQPPQKGLPLPDAAFKAKLSALNIPTVMRAGQKYSIRVLLRNDSSVTWPGLQPAWQFQLTLGNIWLTEAGVTSNNMDGRAALIQDLAPSESVDLPLIITAPSQPGIYILQLDAIQEGVAWFGERGSQVLSLKIKVE